jgi:hypothetical protein
VNPDHNVTQIIEALNCECYLMPCDWFEVGHRGDASDRLPVHRRERNSKTSITRINSIQYRIYSRYACVWCVSRVCCVCSIVVMSGVFSLFRLKMEKEK